MPSTLDRIDFYPPAPQGSGSALSLALIAHLALLGALAWGVNWKNQSSVTSFEAELWSALPQQAAPPPQEAPPPAPPIAAPEPHASIAPDIVLEKKPVQPESKPEIKPKTEPPAKQKPPEKPLAQTPNKPNQANEDKRLAQQKELERQKFMDRMAGLAGTSGKQQDRGSAMQSSGPSSSYAGLIKGRVRPNLVFPGSITGNPQVSVELRLAPDGTIMGRPRVVKSSGNKEWDEAVVRAFEKTEVLPRDGGKVWSPLEIDWRVND